MKQKYIKISLFVAILVMHACAGGPALTPTSTLKLTSTFILTPSLTPTATPILTPTSTSTPSPTPTQIGGGNGKIIFSALKEEYGSIFPDLKGKMNVFMMNLDGSELIPVLDVQKDYYFDVESISPDGSQVLISLFSNWLYRSVYCDLFVVNLDGFNYDSSAITCTLPTHG